MRSDVKCLRYRSGSAVLSHADWTSKKLKMPPAEADDRRCLHQPGRDATIADWQYHCTHPDCRLNVHVLKDVRSVAPRKPPQFQPVRMPVQCLLLALDLPARVWVCLSDARILESFRFKWNRIRCCAGSWRIRLARRYRAAIRCAATRLRWCVLRPCAAASRAWRTPARSD